MKLLLQFTVKGLLIYSDFLTPFSFCYNKDSNNLDSRKNIYFFNQKFILVIHFFLIPMKIFFYQKNSF
jgi:hypothetical protein